MRARRPRARERATALNADSRLAAAALGLFVSVLVWLAVEGGLAVARGRTPGTSLAARVLAGPPPPLGFDADDRSLLPVLESQAALDAMIPDFVRDGVGLGNSPYKELHQSGVNLKFTGDDGCEQNLPDQRRVLVQLRTSLFDRLDPVNAFWDPGKTLSPRVRDFITRYGVREVAVTTDAWGERRTLPESHAERTVIVVGDSISFGVLVDDSETLASQLQSRDPQHRYRNLGIPGIPAHDVLCALDRGLARQPGKVDAIVYTYCENDFESEDDLASPEPVIERLRATARAAGVERVVVVYAPYLYNVVPQLTRFPGQHSDRVKSFRDQHARLRKAVREAGFEWVDFSELVQPEVERTGTQFAAFPLFVEQNHWSREGTRRVADRVQPLLAGAAAAPSAGHAAAPAGN